MGIFLLSCHQRLVPPTSPMCAPLVTVSIVPLASIVIDQVVYLALRTRTLSLQYRAVASMPGSSCSAARLSHLLNSVCGDVMMVKEMKGCELQLLCRIPFLALPMVGLALYHRTSPPPLTPVATCPLPCS